MLSGIACHGENDIKDPSMLVHKRLCLPAYICLGQYFFIFGKLSATDAKAISAKACKALMEDCGGEFSEALPKELCIDCMTEQQRQDKEQIDLEAHRAAVMHQLKLDEENSEACLKGFYVSKSWLR